MLVVPFQGQVKCFDRELAGKGKLPNTRILAKPTNKHVEKENSKIPRNW